MEKEMFAKEQLERIEAWVKESKDSGRATLVYHGDADGACSAAMFLKFFRWFEVNPRKGPIMGDDYVRHILNKKPKLLVFLDLPVDQEKKSLDRFLKGIEDLRIIIIDHHIPEQDVNSERVIHINPRFQEKEAYIPAACVVYRMLEGMDKDVKPLIWMAAMGVIGDYEWRWCKELIDQTREEYPFLLEGDEPREGKLGHGAGMIAAATTLKGMRGLSECLKILLSSEGFEDFEQNRKLIDWKRELDSEFEAILHESEKEKVVYEEGLITYEIKTPLSITSMVATRMGEMFSDKVVMIIKRAGDCWKMSLRNQDGRYNLGDIVKKAVKGIGSGGGHEKAAAGIVNDKELFIKRIRELLRPS